MFDTQSDKGLEQLNTFKSQWKKSANEDVDDVTAQEKYRWAYQQALKASRDNNLDVNGTLEHLKENNPSLYQVVRGTNLKDELAKTRRADMDLYNIRKKQNKVPSASVSPTHATDQGTVTPDAPSVPAVPISKPQQQTTKVPLPKQPVASPTAEDVLVPISTIQTPMMQKLNEDLKKGKSLTQLERRLIAQEKNNMQMNPKDADAYVKRITDEVTGIDDKLSKYSGGKYVTDDDINKSIERGASVVPSVQIREAHIGRAEKQRQELSKASESLDKQYAEQREVINGSKIPQSQKDKAFQELDGKYNSIKTELQQKLAMYDEPDYKKERAVVLGKQRLDKVHVADVVGDNLVIGDTKKARQEFEQANFNTVMELIKVAQQQGKLTDVDARQIYDRIGQGASIYDNIVDLFTDSDSEKFERVYKDYVAQANQKHHAIQVADDTKATRGDKVSLKELGWGASIEGARGGFRDVKTSGLRTAGRILGEGTGRKYIQGAIELVTFPIFNPGNYDTKVVKQYFTGEGNISRGSDEIVQALSPEVSQEGQKKLEGTDSFFKSTAMMATDLAFDLAIGRLAIGGKLATGTIQGAKALRNTKPFSRAMEVVFKHKMPSPQTILQAERKIDDLAKSVATTGVSSGERRASGLRNLFAAIKDDKAGANYLRIVEGLNPKGAEIERITHMGLTFGFSDVLRQFGEGFSSEDLGKSLAKGIMFGAVNEASMKYFEKIASNYAKAHSVFNQAAGLQPIGHNVEYFAKLNQAARALSNPFGNVAQSYFGAMMDGTDYSGRQAWQDLILGSFFGIRDIQQYVKNDQGKQYREAVQQRLNRVLAGDMDPVEAMREAGLIGEDLAKNEATEKKTVPVTAKPIEQPEPAIDHDSDAEGAIDENYIRNEQKPTAQEIEKKVEEDMAQEEAAKAVTPQEQQPPQEAVPGMRETVTEVPKEPLVEPPAEEVAPPPKTTVRKILNNDAPTVADLANIADLDDTSKGVLNAIGTMMGDVKTEYVNDSRMPFIGFDPESKTVILNEAYSFDEGTMRTQLTKRVGEELLHAYDAMLMEQVGPKGKPTREARARIKELETLRTSFLSGLNNQQFDRSRAGTYYNDYLKRNDIEDSDAAFTDFQSEIEYYSGSGGGADLTEFSGAMFNSASAIYTMAKDAVNVDQGNPLAVLTKALSKQLGVDDNVMNAAIEAMTKRVEKQEVPKNQEEIKPKPNFDVPIKSGNREDNIKNKDKFIEFADNLRNHYKYSPNEITLGDINIKRVEKDGLTDYAKKTEIPLMSYFDYPVWDNKIHSHIVKKISDNNDGTMKVEGTLALKDNQDLFTFVEITIPKKIAEPYLKAKKEYDDFVDEYKKLGFKDIDDATRGLNARKQAELGHLKKEISDRINDEYKRRNPPSPSVPISEIQGTASFVAARLANIDKVNQMPKIRNQDMFQLEKLNRLLMYAYPEPEKKLEQVIDDLSLGEDYAALTFPQKINAAYNKVFNEIDQRLIEADKEGRIDPFLYDVMKIRNQELGETNDLPFYTLARLALNDDTLIHKINSNDYISFEEDLVQAAEEYASENNITFDEEAIKLQSRKLWKNRHDLTPTVALNYDIYLDGNGNIEEMKLQKEVKPQRTFKSLVRVAYNMFDPFSLVMNKKSYALSKEEAESPMQKMIESGNLMRPITIDTSEETVSRISDRNISQASDYLFQNEGIYVIPKGVTGVVGFDVRPLVQPFFDAIEKGDYNKAVDILEQQENWNLWRILDSDLTWGVGNRPDKIDALSTYFDMTKIRKAAENKMRGNYKPIDNLTDYLYDHLQKPHEKDVNIRATFDNMKEAKVAEVLEKLNAFVDKLADEVLVDPDGTQHFSKWDKINDEKKSPVNERRDALYQEAKASAARFVHWMVDPAGAQYLQNPKTKKLPKFGEKYWGVISQVKAYSIFNRVSDVIATAGEKYIDWQAKDWENAGVTFDEKGDMQHKVLVIDADVLKDMMGDNVNVDYLIKTLSKDNADGSSFYTNDLLRQLESDMLQADGPSSSVKPAYVNFKDGVMKVIKTMTHDNFLIDNPQSPQEIILKEFAERLRLKGIGKVILESGTKLKGNYRYQNDGNYVWDSSNRLVGVKKGDKIDTQGVDELYKQHTLNAILNGQIEPYMVETIPMTGKDGYSLLTATGKREVDTRTFSVSELIHMLDDNFAQALMPMAHLAKTRIEQYSLQTEALKQMIKGDYENISKAGYKSFVKRLAKHFQSLTSNVDNSIRDYQHSNIVRDLYSAIEDGVVNPARLKAVMAVYGDHIQPVIQNIIQRDAKEAKGLPVNALGMKVQPWTGSSADIDRIAELDKLQIDDYYNNADEKTIDNLYYKRFGYNPSDIEEARQSLILESQIENDNWIESMNGTYVDEKGDIIDPSIAGTDTPQPIIIGTDDYKEIKDYLDREFGKNHFPGLQGLKVFFNLSPKDSPESFMPMVIVGVGNHRTGLRAHGSAMTDFSGTDFDGDDRGLVLPERDWGEDKRSANKNFTDLHNNFVSLGIQKGATKLKEKAVMKKSNDATGDFNRQFKLSDGSYPSIKKTSNNPLSSGYDYNALDATTGMGAGVAKIDKNVAFMRVARLNKGPAKLDYIDYENGKLHQFVFELSPTYQENYQVLKQLGVVDKTTPSTIDYRDLMYGTFIKSYDGIPWSKLYETKKEQAIQNYNKLANQKVKKSSLFKSKIQRLTPDIEDIPSIIPRNKVDILDSFTKEEKASITSSTTGIRDLAQNAYDYSRGENTKYQFSSFRRMFVKDNNTFNRKNNAIAMKAELIFLANHANPEEGTVLGKNNSGKLFIERSPRGVMMLSFSPESSKTGEAFSVPWKAVINKDGTFTDAFLEKANENITDDFLQDAIYPNEREALIKAFTEKKVSSNKEPIKEFVGENEFLDNANPVKLNVDGKEYSSVEQAFQKLKAKNKNPNKSELDIMKDLLLQKFSQEPFRQKLIDTGSREILTDENKNALGKLIMEVRNVLANNFKNVNRDAKYGLILQKDEIYLDMYPTISERVPTLAQVIAMTAKEKETATKSADMLAGEMILDRLIKAKQANIPVAVAEELRAYGLTPLVPTGELLTDYMLRKNEELGTKTTSESRKEWEENLNKNRSRGLPLDYSEGVPLEKHRDAISITPNNAVDKKAIDKATVSNKFIGFGDDTNPKSSTAAYARQYGDRANNTKFGPKDVVFVSVNGARNFLNDPDGARKAEATQKTIDLALSAYEQGATIIADNLWVMDEKQREYNIGEKTLWKALKDKGAYEIKTPTYSYYSKENTAKAAAGHVKKIQGTFLNRGVAKDLNPVNVLRGYEAREGKAVNWSDPDIVSSVITQLHKDLEQKVPKEMWGSVARLFDTGRGDTDLTKNWELSRLDEIKNDTEKMKQVAAYLVQAKSAIDAIQKSRERKKGGWKKHLQDVQNNFMILRKDVDDVINNTSANVVSYNGEDTIGSLTSMQYANGEIVSTTRNIKLRETLDTVTDTRTYAAGLSSHMVNYVMPHRHIHSKFNIVDSLISKSKENIGAFDNEMAREGIAIIDKFNREGLIPLMDFTPIQGGFDGTSIPSILVDLTTGDGGKHMFTTSDTGLTDNIKKYVDAQIYHADEAINEKIRAGMKMLIATKLSDLSIASVNYAIASDLRQWHETKGKTRDGKPRRIEVSKWVEQTIGDLYKSHAEITMDKGLGTALKALSTVKNKEGTSNEAVAAVYMNDWIATASDEDLYNLGIKMYGLTPTDNADEIAKGANSVSTRLNMLVEQYASKDTIDQHYNYSGGEQKESMVNYQGSNEAVDLMYAMGYGEQMVGYGTDAWERNNLKAHERNHVGVDNSFLQMYLIEPDSDEIAHDNIALQLQSAQSRGVLVNRKVKLGDFRREALSKFDAGDRIHFPENTGKITQMQYVGRDGTLRSKQGLMMGIVDRDVVNNKKEVIGTVPTVVMMNPDHESISFIGLSNISTMHEGTYTTISQGLEISRRENLQKYVKSNAERILAEALNMPLKIRYDKDGNWTIRNESQLHDDLEDVIKANKGSKLRRAIDYGWNVGTFMGRAGYIGLRAIPVAGLTVATGIATGSVVPIAFGALGLIEKPVRNSLANIVSSVRNNVIRHGLGAISVGADKKGEVKLAGLTDLTQEQRVRQGNTFFTPLGRGAEGVINEYEGKKSINAPFKNWWNNTIANPKSLPSVHKKIASDPELAAIRERAFYDITGENINKIEESDPRAKVVDITQHLRGDVAKAVKEKGYQAYVVTDKKGKQRLEMYDKNGIKASVVETQRVKLLEALSYYTQLYGLQMNTEISGLKRSTVNAAKLLNYESPALLNNENDKVLVQDMLNKILDRTNGKYIRTANELSPMGAYFTLFSHFNRQMAHYTMYDVPKKLEMYNTLLDLLGQDAKGFAKVKRLFKEYDLDIEGLRTINPAKMVSRQMMYGMAQLATKATTYGLATYFLDELLEDEEDSEWLKEGMKWLKTKQDEMDMANQLLGINNLYYKGMSAMVSLGLIAGDMLDVIDADEMGETTQQQLSVNKGIGMGLKEGGRIAGGGYGVSQFVDAAVFGTMLSYNYLNEDEHSAKFQAGIDEQQTKEFVYLSDIAVPFTGFAAPAIATAQLGAETYYKTKPKEKK